MKQFSLLGSRGALEVSEAGPRKVRAADRIMRAEWKHDKQKRARAREAYLKACGLPLDKAEGEH